MSNSHAMEDRQYILAGIAERVLQSGEFVKIRDGSECLALGAAETVRSHMISGQPIDQFQNVMPSRLALDHNYQNLKEFLPWFQPSSDPPMQASHSKIAKACVQLLKNAALIPIGIVEQAGTAGRLTKTDPMVEVQANAILAYGDAVDASLDEVVRAKVPLLDANDATFAGFRSRLGGVEHYAVMIGDISNNNAPLCRIHSQCFTGDTFGSLKCDCGEQLNAAIQKMRDAGGGVIIYLNQEGRGIGLINKLRAYDLQARGVDTVDANTKLGFEADERSYIAAGRMLEQLGMKQLRLLTNNPLKHQALGEHGIKVLGRLEHYFEPNHYNRSYLETKARRSGHFIPNFGRRNGTMSS